MMRKKTYIAVIFMIMVMGLTPVAIAADGISVNTSADLFNRYIWRGLDIANTPSIQPSLSVVYSGLELGTWGAYTLSNDASDNDEIDFWLSYTTAFSNGVSISAVMTDYYFPNAGIRLFNFNNHNALIDDSIPDPGAHTIEIGISITGQESFPVTLSGYLNVYNDAGSNTYFQLDYPVTVNETNLNFFCGAAGGSKDNAGYYGVEEFAVINFGVTAVREIKVSESFSLPFTVSLIVNPSAEILYLLTGISF